MDLICVDFSSSSIEVLEASLSFPNHGSRARIEALCYGIQVCSIYYSRYKDDFSSRAKNLVNQLEDLYKQDNLKGSIEESIDDNLSSDGKSFLKGLSKDLLQPKVKKSENKSDTNLKSEIKENESSNAFIGWLVIFVIIAFIIFFVY